MSSKLKIRSGGQTGVDRAALDAAIAAGRPYEGWCPKGGWAEDLVEPPGLLAKYASLKETPDRAPAQRTDWNVRDSDATLILVPNSNFESPGTRYTIGCAEKYNRPCHIVFYEYAGAAGEIARILREYDHEQSLNVAGPRESEHPGAYAVCFDLLHKML